MLENEGNPPAISKRGQLPGRGSGRRPVGCAEFSVTPGHPESKAGWAGSQSGHSQRTPRASPVRSTTQGLGKQSQESGRRLSQGEGTRREACPETTAGRLQAEPQRAKVRFHGRATVAPQKRGLWKQNDFWVQQFQRSGRGSQAAEDGGAAG